MKATRPRHLERLLTSLEGATDAADLQAIIEDFRNWFEIGHAVYHRVGSTDWQYRCGTYGREWTARYHEKDYLRIDPVIRDCYHRFQPVDWKRLDWSGKAARAYQREAIAYGLGNQGYSVPLPGPNNQFALFTINHSCSDSDWAKLTGAIRRDLIVVAHCFNYKAQEIEPDRRPAPHRPLSRRELETLSLLALGQKRAQVADTLCISEHTLRVYIESARSKLDAINTIHAVARALRLGLIAI